LGPLHPDLPEIDDYYEPFTFDYGHVQTTDQGRAVLMALIDSHRA